MGKSFSRDQLYARKELIKSIFPNKKEYFYYRDLRDLILRILQDGKKENLDFHTLQFLDTYRNLVEETKQTYNKPYDDFECCGGIYIMKSMRDDAEFQQAYKSLQEFLVKRIESCHRKTNPAEQIMAEEEIRLVLFEKPGLISRCAKPSCFLQHIACEKSPRVIQFIDEPEHDTVGDVVRRDAKNIFLVKPEFRTIYAEVLALIAGVLTLRQLSTEHKKRLVEQDITKLNRLDNGESSIPWHLLIPLVKIIESQSESLTPAQLETFRLYAVGWDLCGDYPIKYIHNPSKAVKEKSVLWYPKSIEAIKFQYPALQQLALFSAFQTMCREYQFCRKADTDRLDSVYKKFTNVMPTVTQTYNDLIDMFCNFNLTTVTKLKYQHEQVQSGLLDLAIGKDIDVSKVFAMFQNPSKKISEEYAYALKEQADRRRREEADRIFFSGRVFG